MPKLKFSDKSIVARVLNIRALVLLSNIVFQGIRYMSFGERIYKIVLSLLLSVPCYLLIGDFLVAIACGHSINYIFNGQFFVAFRYLSSKQVMSKIDLIRFIKLIEGLARKFAVLDVLFIGSFCRGRMSSTSDLDIRIYHKSDLISCVKTYLMASLLRFYGLLYKFPIDVFCFSDMGFLNKISEDETPSNLLHNDDFKNKYPTSMCCKQQLKMIDFS